jgi:hypothetical protein
MQATEEISAFICSVLVDEHGHTVLRLTPPGILCHHAPGHLLVSNTGAVCLCVLSCIQATEEISAFICPALVDEHGHAVLRLSMGRLLDTLLVNMETAAAAAGQAGSSSSSHAKLMMFSGHDSTIMPLLTGGANLNV